jgi:hypothetical protein
VVVGSGLMAGLVYDCALFVLLFRCIICSLCLALFALKVYLFLFVLRFICIICLFIFCFGGKVHNVWRYLLKNNFFNNCYSNY